MSFVGRGSGGAFGRRSGFDAAAELFDMLEALRAEVEAAGRTMPRSPGRYTVGFVIGMAREAIRLHGGDGDEEAMLTARRVGARLLEWDAALIHDRIGFDATLGRATDREKGRAIEDGARAFRAVALARRARAFHDMAAFEEFLAALERDVGASGAVQRVAVATD
ncbi:hypothetical protein [Zavarzinia sp. CC-PAN008]|uniref:hypothetical protein n=1 Tax=Zavarzinia sp. CC-PAN008 TaxID=3243332 RepID=UPI003F743BA5